MSKEIIMDSFNYGEKGKAVFNRVSRWITVKHNYNPKKNNSLWEYVTDGYGYHPYNDNFQKEDKDLFLEWFSWNGNKYAINQFYSLNSLWVNESYSFTENGEKHYLTGVDMYGDLYKPIYIECDTYGEKIRVYEKIRQIY